MDYKAKYEERLADAEKGFEEEEQAAAQSKQTQMSDLDRRKAETEAKYLESLRQAQQQAYIARRTAEMNLPQILAAQGITGGMSETTASNLFNDQMKANTTARKSYDTQISDLNSNYLSNQTTIENDYQKMLADIRQRKRENDLNLANFYYSMMESQGSGSSGGSGGGGGSYESNTTGNTTTESNATGTKYDPMGVSNPYAAQANERGGTYKDAAGNTRDMNGKIIKLAPKINNKSYGGAVRDFVNSGKAKQFGL